MTVKTPPFWYQPSRSLTAHALRPVSWLYQIGHSVNKALQAKPYTSTIPVICVGNAVAGGSGKTPSVIALVQLLKEQGFCKTPYILSRGYGGEITNTTLVDTTKHSAKDVGDEPLLLNEYAPVIIGANRADSAKLAEKYGADLIIMDDGLFHHSLHKTITLLVVDRAVDFGNGLTIPAGPLREPLKNILPRVQGIICIGKAFHSDIPVVESSIDPSSDIDTTQKYIAFAGLGRPKKFKKTLEDNGAHIVGWHPFPDHHPYTDEEITALKKEASEKGAKLITTSKDFIKINSNLNDDIEVLNIELNISDNAPLINLFKSYIK